MPVQDTTILFIEVKRLQSWLSQALPARHYSDTITALFRIIERETDRWGGKVAEIGYRGVILSFDGYAQDTIRKACLCGHAILSAHETMQAGNPHESLKIGIGMDIGKVTLIETGINGVNEQIHLGPCVHTAKEYAKMTHSQVIASGKINKRWRANDDTLRLVPMRHFEWTGYRVEHISEESPAM